MYQRRAQGKAVVVRIWPSERMARFSNPRPLMLNTLCTATSGVAVGGIEVTDGSGGLVTGILEGVTGTTTALSTSTTVDKNTRILSEVIRIG